jgi:CDP-diglyceride synthetase
MRERTLGMMATLFGILYLGLTLLPALRIRYEFGAALGLEWMLILLAVVWTGDTAAMLAGKAFGRTLFSPRISPKTNEEPLPALGACRRLYPAALCPIFPAHVLTSSLDGRMHS